MLQVLETMLQVLEQMDTEYDRWPDLRRSVTEKRHKLFRVLN